MLRAIEAEELGLSAQHLPARNCELHLVQRDTRPGQVTFSGCSGMLRKAGGAPPASLTAPTRPHTINRLI